MRYYCSVNQLQKIGRNRAIAIAQNTPKKVGVAGDMARDIERDIERDMAAKASVCSP